MIELQRKAAFRAMANSLTVNTGSSNRLAKPLLQILERPRIKMRECNRRISHAFNFMVSAKSKRKQFAAKSGWHWQGGLADYAHAAVVGKVNGNGVNTVEAGAGHHACDDHE